ncbi:TetR/AcrR family transcriptional regulator [Yinghuangia sp. YIM S09857]|uniref:TetR/AcrR family transcriptional regulator n=1 Tax=Yinghuangia sp. YIM S09857 TaxID=3436929 RepID=UPI003F53B5B1
MPGRPTLRERDDTSTRLLDAAERIFATRGIEAASVRAITDAAGANVAAVRYHFGSKHDLVRALVERRVGEVAESRRPLFDAAMRRDTVTCRDIAEAWVRPLAAMAVDGRGGRRVYLSFIVVLQGASPEVRAMTSAAFQPQHQQFAPLLERALPDVPDAVRWFRFALAAESTVRALANLDRARAPWATHGGIDDAHLVEHLLDAMAGLLEGPGTPPRP